MAMLELYLIRHGLAEDRGPEWPDDSKRPLTPEGLVRLRKEARALAALDADFDIVISSPLVRTRQTAEVFVESARRKPSLVVADALAPAGTPAAVMQELAKHVRKARVALVGHEPNLGELAGQLIRAKTALPFKKGGICRIDFDVLPPKGEGTLIWFLPPRVLRKLGK